MGGGVERGEVGREEFLYLQNWTMENNNKNRNFKKRNTERYRERDTEQSSYSLAHSRNACRHCGQGAARAEFS